MRAEKSKIRIKTKNSPICRDLRNRLLCDRGCIKAISLCHWNLHTSDSGTPLLRSHRRLRNTQSRFQFQIEKSNENINRFCTSKKINMDEVEPIRKEKKTIRHRLRNSEDKVAVTRQLRLVKGKRARQHGVENHSTGPIVPGKRYFAVKRR